MIYGRAEVKAPKDKMRRPRIALPDVHLAEHRGYRRLMEKATGGEAVATALAHACSAAAITAAVEAAEAGLITPFLVGPEAQIRKAAEEAGKNIAALRVVPAAHSHDAAGKAVALVRAGEARLLMKGSLHSRPLRSWIEDRLGC